MTDVYYTTKIALGLLEPLESRGLEVPRGVSQEDRILVGAADPCARARRGEGESRGGWESVGRLATRWDLFDVETETRLEDRAGSSAPVGTGGTAAPARAMEENRRSDGR